MSGQWLTGNVITPTSYVCRRVRIPNDLDLIMAVNGALLELTYEYRWEQFGAETPAEAAALMATMWYEYQAEDYCMIGCILPHIRSTIPSWSLACDGATHLRVDYPDLYALLPAALIVDADHFITPNLNLSRSPRGTTNPALYGNAGGSETQSISIANLPAHNHSEITAVAAVGAAVTGVPVPSAIPGAGTTGNTGGGTAITFFPRHILTGYIIVAK